MNEPMLDPRHYVRAVTELGEKRPVVATRAIYNTRGVKLLDQGATRWTPSCGCRWCCA